MANLGNSVSRRETQRLERKRCYEARCGIKQCDEQAHAIGENYYLEKFLKEYESLARIQGAMGCHMDDICDGGAAESRRKRIYDVVYRIEAEKRLVHVDKHMLV